MEICLSGAGDEVCAVVHESRALPVHVLYAGICAAGAALGVGQGRLHDAAEIDPGVQEALTMSAGLAAEYAIGRFCEVFQHLTKLARMPLPLLRRCDRMLVDAEVERHNREPSAVMRNVLHRLRSTVGVLRHRRLVRRPSPARTLRGEARRHKQGETHPQSQVSDALIWLRMTNWTLPPTVVDSGVDSGVDFGVDFGVESPSTSASVSASTFASMCAYMMEYVRI